MTLVFETNNKPNEHPLTPRDTLMRTANVSLGAIMREKHSCQHYAPGNPNINHDWLATQVGYNSVI